MFQFTESEGAGYLAGFLARQHIPMQIVHLYQDDPLPASLEMVSGVAMMGGPMSVNDQLPWIAPLLELVREAVRQQVPVIGHCLGGQMLANALGAPITDNPVAEIGWIPARRINTPEAREWLGPWQETTLFQWHYQTFAIPEGAVRILQSEYCDNQAYVVNDLHIGFQCHIEMQADMVKAWCHISPNELRSETDHQVNTDQPAIQTVTEILTDLDEKVSQLNRLAEHVYSRWIKSLRLE
ncbi:type 1 glutamine amidotransferase [Methylobacillus gramineus]|uniref:type 1 glutamine amidotransferase n=1 Tax=Methylobacillus gramineus TaxID=755169 RepID=UPI001CFFC694|nr:type 1 glutamine amidotransferase [Methylobacillus gramineus]MCB5185235.1 type 1 glutamine amidotransferase [Methylobacillus gramineus]